MSRRVIRIGELATTPAKPAKEAEQATANQKAKRAKAAVPAKRGKLPVSPATIWRWVREGKFPKPFKLGASTTVWDAAEVDAFIATRAGGDA